MIQFTSPPAAVATFNATVELWERAVPDYARPHVPGGQSSAPDPLPTPDEMRAAIAEMREVMARVDRMIARVNGGRMV